MRRADRAPEGVDLRAWPFTLAPVAQLLREGLDLSAGVTFLVGENGSGKSTLVEAIAMAYGFNAEGGTRHADHSTRTSESPLHAALTLERSPGAERWGFFLRAETMHGLYTYLDRVSPQHSSRYHEMSHGESFLAVLAERFDGRGLYCLDEPESALSFSSCLQLLALFHDLARDGSQVLCATHSPLLTALPGATILELGEYGIGAAPGTSSRSSGTGGSFSTGPSATCATCWSHESRVGDGVASLQDAPRQGGPTVSQDAVSLILDDHREMETLFAQLQAGEGNRPELLAKVEAMLRAHSEAEEHQVYPVLAEVGAEDDVRDGLEDHHEAEELLEQLRALGPDDEEFDAKLQEFVTAIATHIEEEESELLPMLQQAVSEERLQELARAFAEARDAELESYEGGQDVPRMTAMLDGDASLGSRGSADGRTKSELYEQAKEAGV